MPLPVRSEEGLTFYPLMAAKEKRLLKDEAKLGSVRIEDE